jgi:hypothetical protein
MLRSTSKLNDDPRSQHKSFNVECLENEEANMRAQNGRGLTAALNTDSSVSGNIIALTTITMGTGATLNGRALARNGSVTLLANTITP